MPTPEETYRSFRCQYDRANADFRDLCARLEVVRQPHMVFVHLDPNVPVEVPVVGAKMLPASTWPTAQEIHAVLTAWRKSHQEADQLWKGVSAKTREELRPYHE